MNTENNIKEFGFCHISINTVYNGLTRGCVQQLSWLIIDNYCHTTKQPVLFIVTAFDFRALTHSIYSFSV